GHRAHAARVALGPAPVPWQGRAAEGPQRPRHRHHLHLEGHHDRFAGAPAGRRRRGPVLRGLKGGTTMSRIAKKPIALPKGVELKTQDGSIAAKGPKGALSMAMPAGVEFNMEDGQAVLSPATADDMAITGTMRSIIANMVKGVSEGFERKLELVGVGYRAAMQGQDLNLSLGFSHPVLFKPPAGITITTPTQ